jgi:hypothetical protein
MSQINKGDYKMNKMVNELNEKVSEVKSENEELEMINYNELRNEAKKTMTEEEYRMYDFVLSRYEIVSKYDGLIEAVDSSISEEEQCKTISDLFYKRDEELFNTYDFSSFNKLRIAISKEQDIILCKKALYERKVDDVTATKEDYDQFVKGRKEGMQLVIDMLMEINDSFEEYSDNDIYLNILIDARSILEQDDLELVNDEDYKEVWSMICDAYSEIDFDIDEYEKKLHNIEYIAREMLAKYNLPTNAVGQYY